MNFKETINGEVVEIRDIGTLFEIYDYSEECSRKVEQKIFTNGKEYFFFHRETIDGHLWNEKFVKLPSQERAESLADYMSYRFFKMVGDESGETDMCM